MRREQWHTLIMRQTPLPSPSTDKARSKPMNYARIVLYCIGAVFLIMHFFVYERLIGLYDELDIAYPSYTRYASLLAAGLCFVLGQFAPQTSELDPKTGEYIRSVPKVLAVLLVVKIIVALLMLFIAYVILSPIYSLTSKLQ